MTAAALIAWAVRHEVLLGWAAALFGAVALMGATYALGHHAGVAAERPKVLEAQGQAATAQAQTSIAAHAAQAVDTAALKTLHIASKAEEAAHVVQSAPGATDALDPDLLARWRSGLVGLRVDEAAGAERAGGGQPAQPMPPPRR